MTVYDLYGRVVIVKKGIEIIRDHDMSAEPEGIYLINLQSKERKSSQQTDKDVIVFDLHSKTGDIFSPVFFLIMCCISCCIVLIGFQNE